MIISGTLSVALRHLELGFKLQDAINTPRLHVQLLPDFVFWEPGFYFPLALSLSLLSLPLIIEL